MNIDQLIKKGEEVGKLIRFDEFSYVVDGYDYDEWKASCLIFLETNHSYLTVTKNFIKASEGYSPKAHNEMMGILKAIKEMNP